MRELSIFVDESGDFGTYELHAPFYLVTLVFHDQANKLDRQLEALHHSLIMSNMKPDHCFHAGPIIRREEDYQFMEVHERRRMLGKIIAFARNANVTYTTFHVEKKHHKDSVALTVALTKQLTAFIQGHYSFLSAFDRIVVYYDNGQVELNRILASVFTVLCPQAEFKRVLPVNYRLFQVADLMCTLELEQMKYEQNINSKSESIFFGSYRDMKKNYFKILKRLRLE